MKEVKTPDNNTKETKKKTKYQRKLKERFISQVYPEFTSPVVYLKYKEMLAETAY